jgi:hypothetical protein
MKTKIIIVILSIFVFSAITRNASAQNYTFAPSTGTYSALSGDSLLNDTTVTWDDPFFECPIGFSFNFKGTSYTSVYVTDAYVSFDANETKVFFAMGADLVDRGDLTAGDGSGVSKSDISCLLTGSAGNHILKIQWKNVGFYSGPTSSYVNFQLWLYEGTNKLEVINGDHSVSNPDVSYDPLVGPAIGIVITNASFTAITYSFMLTANSANPATTTWSNINNDPPGLSGTPANGQIYTFTPGSSSIGEISNGINPTVFPNPVNDFLYVSLEGMGRESVQVDILDISGRLLLSKTYDDAEIKGIDFSNFEKGTYIINIITSEGRGCKRFIKL